MKIKAFIFDLDGTLIDTELLWADAMSMFLAERQCPTPKETLLRIVYGRSWTDIYRDITLRFPILSNMPSHVMADRLRVYYMQLREQGDGIIIHSSANLLKMLARHHPVIVVSGSPKADVEEAVRLIGASDQVRFVLGAEDYAPGKPSPAGFLLGATRLGIQAEQCLVFEDSHAGVTAAKAANMWCVALERHCAHPQDLSAADWILHDLSDFTLAGFNSHLCQSEQ